MTTHSWGTASELSSQLQERHRRTRRPSSRAPSPTIRITPFTPSSVPQLQHAILSTPNVQGCRRLPFLSPGGPASPRMTRYPGQWRSNATVAQAGSRGMARSSPSAAHRTRAPSSVVEDPGCPAGPVRVYPPEITAGPPMRRWVFPSTLISGQLRISASRSGAAVTGIKQFSALSDRGSFGRRVNAAATAGRRARHLSVQPGLTKGPIRDERAVRSTIDSGPTLRTGTHRPGLDAVLNPASRHPGGTRTPGSRLMARALLVGAIVTTGAVLLAPLWPQPTLGRLDRPPRGQG